MKKRTIRAGCIALGITTLMGIINFILGTLFEKIIGIKFWGGEASVTYGFGIELLELYPLSLADNPIESHVSIHIAPINFLLTVVVFGIVIYFICFILDKCKKNREYKERESSV